MKSLLLVLAFIFASVLLSRNANAQIQTYSFSGNTSMSIGGIPANTRFSGTFTYNASLTGLTSSYYGGTQTLFSNALSNLSVTIGGDTVSQSSPSTIAMYVGVNPPYSIPVGNSIFSWYPLDGGGPPAVIGSFFGYGVKPSNLYLDFTGISNLSGTTLPSNISSLTASQCALGITVGNSSTISFITSIQLVSSTPTGQVNPPQYTTDLGDSAGLFNQGDYATSIGNVAGYTNQGTYAVAIGDSAGFANQGAYASALGPIAGYINQGSYASAVGLYAGATNQGQYATAVGAGSGMNNQGYAAVAVGDGAGYTGQGSNAIAIGRGAGYSNQPSGSIILNASAENLNGSSAGFFVNPIRSNSITSYSIYYNPTTAEVTYGSAASGIAGPQGPIGLTGPAGATGPAGPAGKNGTNGVFDPTVLTNTAFLNSLATNSTFVNSLATNKVFIQTLKTQLGLTP